MASMIANYTKLMDAWANDASMSDMYDLILDWFQIYKPSAMYPELDLDVAEWLDNAFQGRETNDLVEDFLFGDKFKHLHPMFSFPDTA